MSTNNAKYKKTVIPLTNGDIEIYAHPAHADALNSLLEMGVYEGTKVISLIAAVYTQGKKDGAREVFDKLDVVKKAIPHKNPGKPKKA